LGDILIFEDLTEVWKRVFKISITAIVVNNQSSSKYLIDRLDYIIIQSNQAPLIKILQANQAEIKDLIDLIDRLDIMIFLSCFGL
jgi:hypothetical protein